MPFEFRQFEISFMVAAACILLHDYIFDDTIEEVTDDTGVWQLKARYPQPTNRDDHRTNISGAGKRKIDFYVQYYDE